MVVIHDLTKALISLNSVTQTEVSKRSGVQKGNLSIWLQGKRKLSEQAEESILNALGVYAGELDITQVHVWTTGADLTNLNFVLDTLFTEPPLLQMIIPDEFIEGSKRKITDYPLFSLSSNVLAWVPRIKIILKFKPSLQEQLLQDYDVKFFLKENISKCKWFIDKQPLAIEPKVYKRWQQGKVTCEEFDDLISADRPLTWSDALELSEENDISPSEVVVLLKQLIKNRQDKS